MKRDLRLPIELGGDSTPNNVLVCAALQNFIFPSSRVAPSIISKAVHLIHSGTTYHIDIVYLMMIFY